MNKKASSPGWRVRTDSGACFGPVGMDELRQWARDGRLMATYAVSADGEKTWQPLSELAELEMHDLVEMSAGTYFGPVHRQVVDELIRAGEVPKGASIYRKVAGEDAIAKLEKETLRAESLSGDLKAEKAHAAKLEKQLEKEILRAESLSGDLKAEKVLVQREQGRIRELEDALHDAGARNAALCRAAVDLEAELEALHARQAEYARAPVVIAAEQAFPAAPDPEPVEAPPPQDDPRARLEEQLRRELSRAGRDGFSFLKRK